MTRWTCLLLLPLLLASASQAQRRRQDLGLADASGWGLRLATDLRNPNGGTTGLVAPQADWSHLVVGLFQRKLNRFGGYELGLNLLYKSTGMDLPLVARNPENAPPIGYTAAELQLLAGPRFWDYFFPRIGAQVGYVFQHTGLDGAFQPAGGGALQPLAPNRWLVRVPLGLQLEFPTVWGGVGAGAFYQIQLTNTYRNPGGVDSWDGGSGSSWRFEVSLRIDN